MVTSVLDNLWLIFSKGYKCVNRNCKFVCHKRCREVNTLQIILYKYLLNTEYLFRLYYFYSITFMKFLKCSLLSLPATSVVLTEGCLRCLFDCLFACQNATLKLFFIFYLSSSNVNVTGHSEKNRRQDKGRRKTRNWKAESGTEQVEVGKNRRLWTNPKNI